MTKEELQTIHQLMKDLNYYQLLKLSPIATEQEIRESFHKEALVFHPDQYFSSDDQETKDLAKAIYTQVVAAYRTLSDRKRRAEYDMDLNNKSRIKLKEQAKDEDEDAITGVSFRRAKKTSPGDKFFKLAEQAYKMQDYKSALMNVQIALGSDPTNREFLSFRNRVESLVKK